MKSPKSPNLPVHNKGVFGCSVLPSCKLTRKNVLFEVEGDLRFEFIIYVTKFLFNIYVMNMDSAHAA